MRGAPAGDRIRMQESRWAWRAIASMRGPAAERTTRWLVIANSIAANLFGTAIVFALLVWVLEPTKLIEEDEGPSALTNLYIAAGYVLLGATLGTRAVTKRLAPARRWLIEDRAPSSEEQIAMLRIPIVIFWSHALLWSLAALLFGAFNFTTVLADTDSLDDAWEVGIRITGTVILAGLGTATFSYLLAERLQRPIAARALAAQPPQTAAVPGIKARSIIAWGLGAGLPTAGIVMVGISTLTEQDFSRNDLAIVAVSIGSLAVVLGFLAVLLAARAVADPVGEVRKAMAEVEAGNLDVEVPVYDGSEVGLLQSGFNRMAAGVRERERLHDLFGRHVGEDVARKALEGGVEMGGELRDVAVLFVDVTGSTQLTAERSPHEVVELLNAFFAIVVATVDESGGWINKFEGDAALAVFGAPVALDDAAGRALAAGRTLGRRLEAELAGVEAGIGVSFGPAVAGNIGEERRYEYTVIGDPVNEAARLSDLAKEKPGRVLASERAVSAAQAEESKRWEAGEEVTLRGRSEPTVLATPKASA